MMKMEADRMGVSEATRLYGRSRKWVHDQIDRYQIRTETEENWTRLRLVDLIAHRGELSNSAPQTSETHTEQVQIITPKNRGGLTPKNFKSSHCGTLTKEHVRAVVASLDDSRRCHSTMN